jgi:plastocyanin
MRARLGIVLLSCAGLALAGCGAHSAGASGSAPTPTTVAPANYADKTSERTVTITARDDFVSPQYTKIRKGTTVIFRNGGRNQHNLMSADGAFRNIDTDSFAPGSETKVVFTKVGPHDFYCSLHGTESVGMRGSVLVVP